MKFSLYFQVSNRRGVGKKNQKLIVGRVGILGGLEKSENFKSGERIGFETAFFFPFLIIKTTVLRTFVYTVKVK